MWRQAVATPPADHAATSRDSSLKRRVVVGLAGAGVAGAGVGREGAVATGLGDGDGVGVGGGEGGVEHARTSVSSKRARTVCTSLGGL